MCPNDPRRCSVGGRSIILRVSVINGTYKLRGEVFAPHPSWSSVGCAPMKPRRRSIGGRSIILRVSMVNGTYKLVARYGDNHIQG